ncbi:hypothetical protein [Erythrobacter rubeus]|uniref:hypothetical protein n=1 Tax=Erythrobacter rubeus TaxID=2760803 RepID=UPI001F1EB71B|nr:hypothetical protein [Erythrobacter rubeus]
MHALVEACPVSLEIVGNPFYGIKLINSLLQVVADGLNIGFRVVSEITTPL